ncbi:aminomethyltransferase, putative [Plasmodium ovale wallikeri]|uniref:Aminomethyltransferase, putative n=2 Tax=Plasmodium ovale TaxID=36330 RepID=A0A1A8ZG94_PLAOA|nr:aminomethyltransferase, putative [Plasmodium ovale wallikeri]SBT43349.1 aminomethyltransferase, putative [Plasmodium ovale wallikeri]SBT78414.1 aminomethyltransferase, putative [Plasmodium ovale]
MNNILCKLKNRTLVRVCGTDSFKFLQSLTTNDLNKIINEKDFIQNRNFPKNVLSGDFEKVLYAINNGVAKNKKLVLGLPSLFLLNNGKILFDCFIYNVRHIYERGLFNLFYIDCNVTILETLLGVLKKRKLSCDVDFGHIQNVDVYQLLPCISSLSKRDPSHHNTGSSGSGSGGGSGSGSRSDSDTGELVDSLRAFSGEDTFFFSQDKRSDLLGYRIYRIRDKEEIGLGANVSYTIFDDDHAKMGENSNSCNIDIVRTTNDTYDLLCKFEKAEMLHLSDNFFYDFFKLNLGIIENLYSEDVFFKDIHAEREKDDSANASSADTDFVGGGTNGAVSYSNTFKGDKRKNINRDLFTFKDLSPFDLNYNTLNYLAKDKGCYVGQEAINRTRNEIFINKYQLAICINYDYLDVFRKNFHSLPKTIYEDSVYQKYLKNIKNNDLLKSSFFLLKHALNSKDKIISHQQQYNVIIQNRNTNKDSSLSTNIGHVFFYNQIMGLCFLVKKKITHMTQDLYTDSSNIYIKSKLDENNHRIFLLPLNNNNDF